MLDFRLYTFLTLSETLNYTKAADILCITQPAVSQHIKYLENKYHVKLFVHTGKSLSLTKQGKLFANSIKTMTADEKRLEELLSKSKDTLEHLKFGATLTIGEFILPDRLSAFLSTHSDTSLTMIVENTSNLLHMLDHGEISCAFVEGYFKKTDYAYKTFCTQRYVALKHRDYTLKYKPHKLEDLLQETLIIRESGSGTREVLERVMKEKNLSIPDFHKTIEIGNINAIKQLVKQGHGITFLYESAAQEELQCGEFEIITLEDFNIIREFNFITLRNSIFQKDYDEFLNCIVD